MKPLNFDVTRLWKHKVTGHIYSIIAVTDHTKINGEWFATPTIVYCRTTQPRPLYACELSDFERRFEVCRGPN